LKRASTAIGFLIFNFPLEYLKRLQSSEPLLAKNESNLLPVRITVLHRFLLAGALLFDEKICQSAALFGFGLRDVGIFFLRDAIQRTVDVSPAFLEHGSAEKITVWAHANHDPNKQ
jgi:hypothetical protein